MPETMTFEEAMAAPKPQPTVAPIAPAGAKQEAEETLNFAVDSGVDYLTAERISSYPKAFLSQFGEFGNPFAWTPVESEKPKAKLQATRVPPLSEKVSSGMATPTSYEKERNLVLQVKEDFKAVGLDGVVDKLPVPKELEMKQAISFEDAARPPVGPYGLGERLKDFSWEDLVNKLPFVSSYGSGKSLRVYMEAKYLSSGGKFELSAEEWETKGKEYGFKPFKSDEDKANYSRLRQKAIDDIKEFSQKQERFSRATIATNIFEGGTNLPAFMIEFAATGGLVSGVKQGAKTATQKGLAKAAEKTALDSIKKFVAGKGGRAIASVVGEITAAAPRTVAMPHRVAEKFLDRQLSGMSVQNGEVVLEERPAGKDLLKGFLDVYTENLSEVSGVGIGKAIAKVPMLGRIVAAFEKKIGPRWMSMVKRGGYDGFIEELSEERVKDVLDWSLGVRDFQLPTGKQLLIEAGVLAIPSAVGLAGQAGRYVLKPSDKLKTWAKQELADNGETFIEQQPAPAEQFSQEPIEDTLETLPVEQSERIREKVRAVGSLEPIIKEYGEESPLDTSVREYAQQVYPQTETQKTTIKQSPKNLSKQGKDLVEEVIGQWELESGESRESARLQTSPENIGDDLNFVFHKKLPSEITDLLQRAKDKLRLRQIFRITDNAGEAMGQETLNTLGSGEAMVEAARQILSGKRGQAVYGLEQAEKWARDTGNAAMLLRIEQYRAIQSGNSSGIEIVKMEDLKLGDKFTVAGEATTVIQSKSSGIGIKGKVSGDLNRGDTVAIDAGSLEKNTLSPDVTTARQADLEVEREIWQESGMPSKERKTFKQSMDNAVQKGIPEKALRLAAEVIDKPRVLSDEETAGMVRKLAQLKNEYKVLMSEIGTLTDDGLIATKAAEISRVELEHEALTRAIYSSGTEAGRALSIRRLAINKDYELISILNRAKVAKGKALTEAERSKILELTQKLEAETLRADQAQQQVNELKAQKAVKEGGLRRYNRMNTLDKDAELAVLLGKTRNLLKAGCY